MSSPGGVVSDAGEVYELTTLSVPVGATRSRLPELLTQIRNFAESPEAEGRLVGCWIPDFGPQNRILVLRAFDSLAILHRERHRLLTCPAPFLPTAQLTGLSVESYIPFPGLPPIASGALGPVYEFRTYTLKIGGLEPTVKAWHTILPQRTALSPLITAMYALDGVPRFIHIWAYKSHDAREQVRSEAFRTKAWPAPGAPAWLSGDLRSESMVPTAISPLQ